MPEDYDLTNFSREDWVHWFVVHMFSDCGKEKTDQILAIANARKAEGKPSAKLYDIEVRINGVEVPAAKAFRDAGAQFDDQVGRKAVELVAEKFTALSENAYAISSMIDNARTELSGKLTELLGYNPDHERSS